VLLLQQSGLRPDDDRSPIELGAHYYFMNSIFALAGLMVGAHPILGQP
jgi:hypothetical protein